MTENQFKHKEETSNRSAETPKNGKKNKSISLGKLLKGDFFTESVIATYMPFAGFLTVLALLYIANAYYAERKVNAINETGKKVKDLHSKYVSAKAELMFSTQRSELSSKLSNQGIKETVTPPYVIKIEKDKSKIIY